MTKDAQWWREYRVKRGESLKAWKREYAKRRYWEKKKPGISIVMTEADKQEQIAKLHEAIGQPPRDEVK